MRRTSRPRWKRTRRIAADVMPSFERFVIQKKQKDGSYVDWPNPMTGQVEYTTYAWAREVLLRRSPGRIGFQIVRREWKSTDVMVSSA